MRNMKKRNRRFEISVGGSETQLSGSWFHESIEYTHFSYRGKGSFEDMP